MSPMVILFNFFCGIIHIKFTFLTILKVQFNGIKYIYSVVQPLSLFKELFHHSRSKPCVSLSVFSFPHPLPCTQPQTTTNRLSVFYVFSSNRYFTKMESYNMWFFLCLASYIPTSCFQDSFMQFISVLLSFFFFLNILFRTHVTNLSQIGRETLPTLVIQVPGVDGATPSQILLVIVPEGKSFGGS